MGQAPSGALSFLKATYFTSTKLTIDETVYLTDVR